MSQRKKIKTRLLTGLVKEGRYDISKQLLDVEGFLTARILLIFDAFENVLCLRTNGREASFQRLPPALMDESIIQSTMKQTCQDGTPASRVV